MDYLGTEAMKQAYADSMIELGNAKRAEEVLRKQFQDPLFEGYALHPEAEPSKEKLNSAFTEIAVDLKGLDLEVTYAANRYAALLDNIVGRFQAVDDILKREEDRIRDMNAINGQFSEFASVKSLTLSDFTGNCSHGETSSILYCQTGDVKAASFTVDKVVGNGYSGNKYVLDKDGKPVQNSVNTSDSSAVTDGHTTSSFEYSRLTATGSTEGLPQDVNKDDEEARCTLYLSSDGPVSMMNIKTGCNEVLEEVFYSQDKGLTYKRALYREIEMNNPDKKYSDPCYAYGSGIICFPASNYFKIQLSSKGVTDEKIGTADKVYDNVHRHVIKIEGISGLTAAFASSSIQTAELVPDDNVTSIAIFANEYIPLAYKAEEQYIQYFLTVNGVTYEVVPINSNKSGTKVIRFSKYANSESYVEHIKESIKKASLKIIMKAGSNTTPVLSNIKVCYGKVDVS